MKNINRSAKIELILIGIVALTFSILELYIDTFERLVIWAAENESLFITELLTLAILLSIGLSIYSYRRWQEIVQLEKDKNLLQETVLVEQDANQFLRLYSDAVTEGQETERRRLARELHDDTIQRLILLNQKVELAVFDLADSAASTQLHAMQTVIAETIYHVRHFIQELRPSYLDELGLVPTLRNLTKQTRERTDLFIEFEMEGNTPRLNESIELGLYRITQSALANIIQHANASMVQIKIRYDPKAIQLDITDDGDGFMKRDEISFARDGHYGLLGMKERAELIGAQFILQTEKKEGTTISIHVPLK